jgi:hypothetical protein
MFPEKPPEAPPQGTRKGQNHAVHGFVGAPQASMDGRITEVNAERLRVRPGRKSGAGNAQGIEAVSFFAAGEKDTSGKPGFLRQQKMRPKFLCLYPA